MYLIKKIKIIGIYLLDLDGTCYMVLFNGHFTEGPKRMFARTLRF